MIRNIHDDPRFCFRLAHLCLRNQRMPLKLLWSNCEYCYLWVLIMPSYRTFNIVLNVITLVNLLIAIAICVFIFGLVMIFHRRTRSVPILLACHTCLTLLVSSIMLGSMILSSLLGFIHLPSEQQGNPRWCRWRGFLIHGCLCALYDSYMLQATYRLCRVVFYQRKYLHTFSLYVLLVVIETFVGVFSLLPVLIRGDIVYLASEYFCQTPFTNVSAMMYIAVRLFLLPILFIISVYIYLLYHIRRSGQVSISFRHNSQRNRRDLIVIRRLLLTLTILIMLALPSVIFLLIFTLTGHLLSLTYRVGWFSVSFSLVSLAYMLIGLTRPLKKTVQRLFSRWPSGEKRFDSHRLCVRVLKEGGRENSSRQLCLIIKGVDHLLIIV